MCPDVSLQQPGAGEALAAGGALAALVVGAHVLAEGGRAHVHLIAIRTLASCALVVRRAMRLPGEEGVKVSGWHHYYYISFSLINPAPSLDAREGKANQWQDKRIYIRSEISSKSDTDLKE